MGRRLNRSTEDTPVTTAMVRTTDGGVATADGEIVYAPDTYLASLNGGGLRHQQQLAAAYDAACKALIGPNDVQKEGGREFKKKSAWRKLARHFRISVTADRDDARIQQNQDGSWIAIARATAVAPWGQSFTDVGGCGSDEQTGRRTITMADALATAMTRATNRAVSNLIAMGEVSAEEIGDRKTYNSAPATRATAPQRSSSGPTLPFGKSKGTALAAMDERDLRGALEWAESHNKYVEFQAEARAELESRGGVAQDGADLETDIPF